MVLWSSACSSCVTLVRDRPFSLLLSELFADVSLFREGLRLRSCCPTCADEHRNRKHIKWFVTFFFISLMATPVYLLHMFCEKDSLCSQNSNNCFIWQTCGYVYLIPSKYVSNNTTACEIGHCRVFISSNAGSNSPLPAPATTTGGGASCRTAVRGSAVKTQS